eukprot:RCo048901
MGTEGEAVEPVAWAVLGGVVATPTTGGPSGEGGKAGGRATGMEGLRFGATASAAVAVLEVEKESVTAGVSGVGAVGSGLEEDEEPKAFLEGSPSTLLTGRS